MDNLYYYNAGREVPNEAKRPIMGGRMNGKTDINPMWRIKKLTEMFGPCGVGWYYKSVREWIEPYEKEVAAFVKIELYIKVNGEWSMPIQGSGGSAFVEIQKGSPYVSDECYKMATTDAISVACKQLGIGADVYWDSDRSKYGNQDSQEPELPAGSRGKDGQQQEGSQRPAVDDETIQLRKELSSELIRVGYTWNSAAWKSMIKKYRTEQAEQLSKLQLKDCISRMKRIPDKAAS